MGAFFFLSDFSQEWLVNLYAKENTKNPGFSSCKLSVKILKIKREWENRIQAINLYFFLIQSRVPHGLQWKQTALCPDWVQAIKAWKQWVLLGKCGALIVNTKSIQNILQHHAVWSDHFSFGESQMLLLEGGLETSEFGVQMNQLRLRERMQLVQSHSW